MATEDADPIGKLEPEEKLERFRGWFKLTTDAEADQRAQEEEDLDFQLDQWDAAAKKARAGRPVLSVSLLIQPMQLVQNQAANARMGVELHPVSEDADKDLAEIKQGLYQRIQRDGGADQARLWALDRAKQCGRGWYRISTQYDEDSDDPSDQEIVYERILHQEMVYVDPAAQRPDFSDARFAFIAAYMPMDRFCELYPQAECQSSEDFASLNNEAPEWVRVRGEGCDPLVAEVFYAVSTIEEFKVGEETRRRTERVIWRAVLTGREILEDAPWMGGRRYIPLVPVIGRELQPVHGQRRWEGLVRPARDAQRVHNYAVSTLVERLALEPKAPFIVHDEAIEPYQAEWDEANTTNRPYLRVKMTTAGGQPLPAPSRAQIDGSGMNLALMAVQQSRDWVQATTAVFSPALGDVPRNRESQSGRAILALQQQTEAGTSNYLDNLRLVSLPLDARIVLDLMPVVYDRPGRITQILGDEDKSRTVMLNAPFVADEAGRPRPATSAETAQKQARTYDLSKGRYSIAATVGKSPQTRLQHGQEFLTSVIQAAPDLVPMIGDLIFRFRDEPGAREIAERFRRQIQSTQPHLLDGNKDRTVEDLRAETAALQAQLQQFQQQLQQATAYIQTEQAKHQASIQIATIRAQTAAMIAQVNAETKLKLAAMNAEREAASDAVASRDSLVRATIKAQSEAEGRADDHAHEDAAQQMEMAHEVGMAAAQGAGTDPLADMSKAGAAARRALQVRNAEDGMDQPDPFGGEPPQ